MNRCILTMDHKPTLSGLNTSSRFKNVQVIFFDLDDTLCAYWNACKEGLRKTFEELRPEGISAQEMTHVWATAFRKFCPHIKESKWYPHYLKSGKPTRDELMRLTLAELGIDDKHLASKMGDLYSKHRNSSLRPFPDTYEALKALSLHYELGVITNGPADVQNQELETLSLKEYFQYILIEGELGVGKPSPFVFEEAERLSGRSKDSILMVGNSYDHDILPAIHSDWQTAWIYRLSDIPPSSEPNKRPYRLKPDDIRPNATIFSLKQLLPLLTKI